MSICLIGLGSNQGDRQAALEAAVAELRREPQVTVVAVSAWRETAPVGGPPGQAHFLNGALKAETSLEPQELLACLQRIEDRLGRKRGTVPICAKHPPGRSGKWGLSPFSPAEHWGPRTIDLDLLLYDEIVLDTPSLVLPHPRMAWRRFVLEPAAEVAGEMLHPTIGWTVSRLLEHLNSAQPYVAITGAIAAGKTQLAKRLAAAISARLISEQPDWDRLEAFYTDPAGHAWQMELEFLCQRAELLTAEKGDSPHLPATNASRRCPPSGCFAQMGTVPFFSFSWTVSDFWFDQSAAFARAWLTEKQLPPFLDQYEQLRQEVVRPKLIVLLDVPAEKLLARVRRRGRAPEQRLTIEQLERIRQAVREQASQPELGPVLRAAGDDSEAIFAEVLAAVRGME